MVDPSPFINALIGKGASDVWLLGVGPGLNIDFGQFTPNKFGEVSLMKGELSLMVDSDWRIEIEHSILCGSRGYEDKWPGIRQKLIGASVTNVEIFGHLPEIAISFSTGLRVVSFMTEDEGQPGWVILTGNPFIGHLCVREGRLSIDTRNS